MLPTTKSGQVYRNHAVRVGLWLALPVFFVLLGSGGCRFEPTGGVRYQMPEIYQEWWRETEDCAGQAGDLSQIEWYAVDGSVFQCPVRTNLCYGWWSADHRIYVARSFVLERLVIRHEMMHDIINSGEHPTPPFYSDCSPEFPGEVIPPGIMALGSGP